MKNQRLCEIFIKALIFTNFARIFLRMQVINKLLLFVLFVILNFACGKSETKIPDSIQSPKMMTEILVEVHMVDAAVNLSSYGQPNLPTNKEKIFLQIYQKYGISKKQFEESFNYYTAHPELFEKIYAEVIAGLSRKQAELSK